MADSNIPSQDASYDAIVVGSGYGGAVAAYRLAQAGVRVCILEKGRKWDAHEFPTTFSQVLSNVRVHAAIGSFGRKDALYQVYFQRSSVAIVGAGLGGGSLINAGVVLPTPIRARRDPRWPEEWERKWHASQNRALAMLEPESVPHTFPNGQVLDALANEIEDTVTNSVELSVRFKDTLSTVGVTQNSCTACGNCLTGCPYNAKNSVDKNYLAAAIEAGAMVRTGCEVLFVLLEPDTAIQCNVNCESAFGRSSSNEAYSSKGRNGRRWRVYVNEIDYLSADYVVLSAGVVGTTKILLHSKERGLTLSEKLGFGMSCNGNHVGFVAGARAPTKGYSLSKSEFARTSMSERPGPSITNAYTSSLGFTIEGAVLPEAFSFLLFKCMATCGWRYGLFNGIVHKLKRWMKRVDSESLILNMMGHDLANGRIELNKQSGLVNLTPPYDPLLTKKISTIQKLAKRMGGVLFLSPYSTTTVHMLGGCNAARDITHGVTNSSGQVFDFCGSTNNNTDDQGCCRQSNYCTCTRTHVSSQSASTLVHPGLYVCDASLIPCAVGVNPSLTITTVAEHVSRSLVEDLVQYYSSHSMDISKSSIYCSNRGNESNLKSSSQVEIKRGSSKHENANVFRGKVDRVTKAHEAKVIVKETLSGILNGMPCTLDVIMHMGSKLMEEGDLGRMKTFARSDSDDLLRGKVGGELIMPLLDASVLHIVDGTVDMCWLNPRTPFTQYMHYHLLLASSSGAKYILDAKKEMHPFLLGSFSWQESTTLRVTLRQISNSHAAQNPMETRSLEDPQLLIHGTLTLSLIHLLQPFVKLRGPKRMHFVVKLAQNLMRTYFSSKPRVWPSLHKQPADSYSFSIQEETYPSKIVHEIQTGDGIRISVWQWLRCQERNGSTPSFKERIEHARPILLLNGYSGESFFLPTEEKDLVRTLLLEGYEPWLLRPRLHPTYCTTKYFTIDDLAHFDIPAAFSKIAEVHGYATPVHVIAHCIGGLAIHMAILGGIVSVSSVASLTCTNSSMFFNVTSLAMTKLTLPIIPILVRLLGRNTVLSFSSNKEEGWRHKLAKCIAKVIPRVESCTCNECELFSGIFGNAFWHQNVSERLHEWISKETLVRLPVTGFVQLRRICKAGKVVDCNGEDTYLPFIKRLEVPTTYISGGRPLLVTPSTTERAHALMLQHHPQLRHRRFLIADYGHSDLLIGEDAHHDVFPHILQTLKEVDHPTSDSSATSNHIVACWETFPTRSSSYVFLLIFLLSLWIIMLL